MDKNKAVLEIDMPSCCYECFALDDNGDYPRCLITNEQRGYTFRTREQRMDKCPLKPKTIGRIQIGDIVRHFKYETISEEEKKQNKYLYRIKDIAEHTETGEKLVIYEALYSPFKTYARPLGQFCEKLDHTKHPYITQRYRFEKHDIQPKYDI